MLLFQLILCPGRLLQWELRGDTHLQPLNMVPLGTEPENSGDNLNNTLDRRIEDKVKSIVDEAADKGTI